MSCYGRNFEIKNVLQVILSEISFSELSTFWADKTVFDFKVSTLGEIIRPSLTDFRAVLSCLIRLVLKMGAKAKIFVYEF